MIVTQKIEIQPTKEQQKFLSSYFGARRWCWNKCLETWKSLYAKSRELKDSGIPYEEYKESMPNCWKVRDLVKLELKDWFEPLPMQILETAAEDLARAYELYFRKLKTSKNANAAKGHPKFKTKYDEKQQFVFSKRMILLFES